MNIPDKNITNEVFSSGKKNKLDVKWTVGGTGFDPVEHECLFVLFCSCFCTSCSIGVNISGLLETK